MKDMKWLTFQVLKLDTHWSLSSFGIYWQKKVKLTLFSASLHCKITYKLIKEVELAKEMKDYCKVAYTLISCVCCACVLQCYLIHNVES